MPKLRIIDLYDISTDILTKIRQCNLAKELELPDRMDYCLSSIENSTKEARGLESYIDDFCSVIKEVYKTNRNLNRNINIDSFIKEIKEDLTTVVAHYENANNYCSLNKCKKCIASLEESYNLMEQIDKKISTIKVSNGHNYSLTS